eukprot:TRINITY_DN18269_c0_g1_i1.p1 TRINITY_DN18269_c0_g1~~TRINITY_DN18269_c0_g1_i1.p1  ORF type:complete len:1831 (+),score=360.08 TRINITY_DN18269_c0_g1_i1:175-5667(+)
MALHPLGQTIVFADHVEARQMGEHTRELRFPEPFALHSLRVVARNEQPQRGLPFEGRTYPDLRTIGLEVFAADSLAPSSTQARLQAASPGVFVPPREGMMTSCITFRGKFIKLSLAIFGKEIPAEEVPPLVQPSLAQHLRPAATYDADKLDLADLEDPQGRSEGRGAEQELNLNFLEDERMLMDSSAEAGAPSNFGRALGLGAVQEANTRLTEHAAWVARLPHESEVLEGEAVVGRLQSLASDIALLAQRAPESAAHVSLGPELSRSLLTLASRCVERLEFRPLRATLQALATCLVSVTAAREILAMKGGLDVLVSILKENEWCQLSLKLAALQALLQLCSHAAGMEAFLAWSEATSTSNQTAYEVVMSLAVEGTPGLPRLEQVALTLLRRASLYETLARLDEKCCVMEGAKGPGGESQQESAKLLNLVAEQLEVLSQPMLPAQDAASSFSLLGEDCPSMQTIEESAAKLPSSVFGTGTGSVAGDSFAFGQCQLHGFLESFLIGRRLLPNLCVLLRNLPRMQTLDGLAVYSALQRLLCALLSCAGGPQLLASDTATLASLLDLLGVGGGVSSSRLPAVPRFPALLVAADLSATQLASLIATHVRAMRLSLLLVAKTRSKGRGGLLPESEAVPILASLHRLGARGSAGRGAVVFAFRSVFFVEWLLRQLEGRLEEAVPTNGGSTRPSQLQPSLRHLIALLHTLVLSDQSGAIAERFGHRALTLVSRAIQALEPGGAEAGDGVGAEAGSGRGSALEFALDSEGAQGGLGRAVRFGRRTADLACAAGLRELLAQLRPWRQEETDASTATSTQTQAVATAKLMACLAPTKTPSSFKRSANDERGSRHLALVLGGHAGAVSGVEVPEVEFCAEEVNKDGEPSDDHERFPSEDLAELPLVAMRVLCRRAASCPREALAIAVNGDDAEGGGLGGKDGLSQLVPWLIRCAGALNLNLEATILREEKKSIASIYATRRNHAQLLESILQTCAHLILGLRNAGMVQYRNTDFLQALMLLAQRLSCGLSYFASGAATGGDPEFRFLWRHCLAWVCRVFRLWVQSFPEVAGGQLLQPLLRNARILPSNFSAGLMLLATCGGLESLLPSSPHSFALLLGASATSAHAAPQPGTESLQSQSVMLPAGTRGGSPGIIVLRSPTQPAGSASTDRSAMWGQFWGKDGNTKEWESADSDPAYVLSSGDPLVRALASERQSAAAQALGLVEVVNRRRERLSLDDFSELLALVSQSALTSDALLHLCTARIIEKLTSVGVPVLTLILRLAEASLHGVVMSDGDQPASEADQITGGAARDDRDARAVSRLLLLLAHFGTRTASARMALIENQAETFCLKVLAFSPSNALPPTAMAQAIRLLGLMFSMDSAEGTTQAVSASVPKCRMVSKAMSLLINKADDGQQQLPDAQTMAAALELLSSLCSVRWLCLNLLFSVTEEVKVDEEQEQLSVSVGCAFRLAHCSSRAARELMAALEQCRCIEKGTEEERLASEELTNWCRVTELLVGLSRSVVAHCPSPAVLLEHILGDASLQPQAVMENCAQALTKIVSSTTATGHFSEVAMAAAKGIEALRRELQAKSSFPVPSTLAAKDILSPHRKKSETAIVVAKGENGKATKKADTSMDDGSQAMQDAVSLLDSVADLEASAEWCSVAELDSSAPSPDVPHMMELEFDAAILRRKRQAFLEKAESERNAKRLKQQQEKQKTEPPAATAQPSPSPSAPAKAAAPTRTAASPPAQEPAAPKSAAPPAAKVAKTEPVEPKPAMEPTKPKPAGGGAADALGVFLKDHPEFMRILQNPTKCLADPRVKSMFMSELQKYPAVKSFLVAKGVQLS